jgi:hypothetical protein
MWTWNSYQRPLGLQARATLQSIFLKQNQVHQRSIILGDSATGNFTFCINKAHGIQNLRVHAR